MRYGIRFLFESSGFLIAGAIAALLWANLSLESYHSLIHSVEFWVNDVLMCFFFAIAAKEIRESILPGGKLNTFQKALLPLVATVGGMAGPALLYLGGCWVVSQPALQRGWAIPCATDIAFSYLVAKLIFGTGHPAISFLLLLAIADDAGGLLILATCYPTQELNLPLVGMLAAVALAIGALFNYVMRLNSFWPYLVIPGTISWFGFYLGGIHPALALVPIIFIMPHAREDLGLFTEEELRERGLPTNPKEVDDSLNRFEHWWKHPVELFLGCFGLVNAGVVLSSVGAPTMLVLVGLCVGKPLGIFLCTLAGYACGLRLPAGMTFRDVFLLGIIAGVGFTVALFVATVAFPVGSSLDAAKMGALASLGVGAVAWLVSRVIRPSPLVPPESVVTPVTLNTQVPSET